MKERKEVGKKELIDRQSPEFIKQAEEGKFLKLIPDTFVIKMMNGTQGYAIRHLNRRDLILIDSIERGAELGIKELLEEGYNIRAILVTHKEVLQNAYASLKKISEDAGGAPIFSHPMNSTDSTFEIKDITRDNPILDDFSISARDFPTGTGETAVIHSQINEGMVFTGNAAIGSSYDSDDEKIERPETGSKSKDFSLAESWRSYMREFRYLLPYKGKPKFNLSEGEQKDIVVNLGRTDYSGGGNPNL